jgi:hypothetical protein
MKSLLIVMLAAAAISLAADDPGGWSKAKWGMTDAQISEAFGAEAIHLDAPDENGVRTVVLLDLAGVPCFAEMLPDQTGRLASVMILPRKVSDMTETLYLAVKKMLIQKYGPPSKTSETPRASGVFWTFPTTIIGLVHGAIPPAQNRGLAITYGKATPASNPL